MPATDAVRMIDPEPCGRITPTAARMPLTAPSTLMRKERSQSSLDKLWMRPFGASTPALLTRTSSRPKRSTASATTASTCAGSLTSASRVAAGAPVFSTAATVAANDCSATSLNTNDVPGSLPSRPATAAPRAPPAPVMATTRPAAPTSAVMRGGIRRRPSGPPR